VTRPAFQFYPGDWQKNAKLRRCSPAARGVWMDVLCLLHDSEDEYGVLRWPLKDIANAAGASMSHVRELVEKGVLKGADKEAPAYVYRPKHAGKAGDPVTLVISDGGPVWYSSRFVRDEWVRQRRGESTRFDTANQPDSRSPKGGLGDRQGDGPSTSSSPSGSEANASAAAGAPASVDNPDQPPLDPPPAPPPPPDPPPSDKRLAWNNCGRWMVTNGVAESSARELMGVLLKTYPLVALDAMLAAPKQQPATPDPKAYLTATAKRMSGERATVPSDDADKTAEMLRTRMGPLTEDERAASEAARQRVMAGRLKEHA
jgi:hypothetical protein